jgi:uncharacterized protein YbaP (TraB family)
MKACLTALALGLALACNAFADTRCPPPPAQPSAEQLQAAQREARDHGLLWRISKHGRESWLFGTLHVGRLEWSAPGPVVRQALAGSEVLALEIDPADPALAAQMREAMRNAPAADPALRQRLQQQASAACLPDGALQGVPPTLQLMTLTLLQARHDALDAAFGQEQMLTAHARAAGLRIVALESVAQQLDLLFSADAALLDAALDQLEAGRSRVLMRRLAQAWADGDLDLLERYEQWCECADTAAQRAWLHRLNDARNAPLAAGIDALHAAGNKVFAAVGALHMTGPQALPRLLQERGYMVQRVRF